MLRNKSAKELMTKTIKVRYFRNSDLQNLLGTIVNIAKVMKLCMNFQIKMHKDENF